MRKSSHNASNRIGQTFGELIVVAQADRKKWGSRDRVWQCRCSCGNDQVYVTTSALRNGSYRSCGCLHQIKRDTGLNKHIQEDCMQGTRKSSLKAKAHTDSKSGIKGVCYDASRQKWRAYIGFKRKTITLGYFTEVEDAMKARKQGEAQYHAPILQAKEPPS